MLSCCFANGQSFEVASIHRNPSGSLNTGINILPGGRMRITNATLKTLIRNAYGILSFQLAGETGWIDSEYYDIEAKRSHCLRVARGQSRLKAQSQFQR